MEMEVYDAVYARQSHDVRDSLSIDMQIGDFLGKMLTDLIMRD